MCKNISHTYVVKISWLPVQEYSETKFQQDLQRLHGILKCILGVADVLKEGTDVILLTDLQHATLLSGIKHPAEV